MKKILALALATVMVLALCGTAFASAVNNLTVDPKVTINGLTEGDTVTLYQVLEWGTDGYWVAKDPFSDPGNSLGTQTIVDDLVGQNHETGELISGNGGLDAYIDAIIVDALNATPVTGYSEVSVGSTGKFEATGLPAGMYYAQVTPKDATTIYKPIFISADYKSDNGTSEILDTIITTKKETITIDKTATAQTPKNYDEANTTVLDGTPENVNTVGIGDTVEFQIQTSIPAFPASFKTPVFKVSDTLNGLTLNHTTGEIKVYKDSVADANLLTEGTEYSLTATDSKFTVSFASDWITQSGGTSIYVVYSGDVDNTANYDMNVKENTATVNFSNNPNDQTGANELKDETRHYTFSIDALVTGSRHGTDLIKIGISEDGTEITETVELPNGNEAGALEGAKFTLYDAESGGNVVRDNLTSDGQGLIEINGLDAGTYWLEETEAPAGYIKQPGRVKIEIIPEFEIITVAAETKDVEYIDGSATKTVTITVPEYKYAVLKSFTIKIADRETATYTVENSEIKDLGDDIIKLGSEAGKVKNTKGVELPSTGGIGTTIFYITGLLMVLGAATILVARRKADAE